MPVAAYVLSGILTVEKKSTGEKRLLKAGDVLPEMINNVHRGYTGKEGATLLVFYAGEKGLPRSEPAGLQPSAQPEANHSQTEKKINLTGLPLQ
ncbi:hypothetical protein [Trabulsiella odontotermitis]|uniref:hypothetical protein n=1 Tax=Trabulsiella odontotermitis TaxID=379893 RepID=UPI000A4A61C7|nr:hypothetical protein [Trabulsiella odontotermitis]